MFSSALVAFQLCSNKEQNRAGRVANDSHVCNGRYLP